MGVQRPCAAFNYLYAGPLVNCSGARGAAGRKCRLAQFGDASLPLFSRPHPLQLCALSEPPAVFTFRIKMAEEYGENPGALLHEPLTFSRRPRRGT